MVSRNFEMAMQAIRNGNMDEGGRLMRIVLKEELPANIRAVALMWLAETNPDIKFKLDCYREAQQYDPNNQDVATRLSSVLASQLPPSGNTPPYGMSPTGTQTVPQVQPPAQPSTSYPGYPQYANQIPTGTPTYPSAQPVMPQQPLTPNPQPIPAYNDPFAQQLALQARANDPFVGQPPLDIPTLIRTVGISGGPNGIGTGFFISTRGMVVTTRYVVGSNVQVDVILPTGQSIPGFVVRSFPSFDLAFIRVNAIIRQLSPLSSVPVIMDETPLMIVNYKGENIRTTKRMTKQDAPAQWFPTLISELTDAGGNAVFDARGVLLGMMTKNALRSNNYLYGLHLSAIVQSLDVYAHEIQQTNGTEVYCPSCGCTSKAPIYGGFYCETCGSTLPQFAAVSRYPQANQNLSALYQELNVPCKKCGSRVGYYNTKCLRCEDNSI